VTTSHKPRHLQPATALFKGAAGNELIADVFGDTGQPVLLLHGGRFSDAVLDSSASSTAMPDA
jgi:hypothetical protein